MRKSTIRYTFSRPFGTPFLKSSTIWYTFRLSFLMFHQRKKWGFTRGYWFVRIVFCTYFFRQRPNGTPFIAVFWSKNPAIPRGCGHFCISTVWYTFRPNGTPFRTSSIWHLRKNLGFMRSGGFDQTVHLWHYYTILIYYNTVYRQIAKGESCRSTFFFSSSPCIIFLAWEH